MDCIADSVPEIFGIERTELLSRRTDSRRTEKVDNDAWGRALKETVEKRLSDLLALSLALSLRLRSQVVENPQHISKIAKEVSEFVSKLIVPDKIAI